MDILKLCALQGTLLNISFQLECSDHLVVQLGAEGSVDLLLALGTCEEGENDTGGDPLLTEDLEHAVHVEHVPAAEFYGWFVSEARSVADLAIITGGAAVENLVLWGTSFIESFDAVFLEAGETALFVFEAAAGVVACLHLLAAFVHKLDAVGLTAHVLESRDHADRSTTDYFLTEAALSCFLVGSSRLASVS